MVFPKLNIVYCTKQVLNVQLLNRKNELLFRSVIQAKVKSGMESKTNESQRVTQMYARKT